MIVKLFQLPQIWLALFCAAGFALGLALPVSLPPILRVAGFFLFGAGSALMIWAAGTMSRAKTTVMPGRVPTQMVTSGPFAFSRNPIYLGDLVIFVSLMLALDTLAGLVLLPVFAILLERLFICREEQSLQAHFAAGFTAYQAKVRRWI